MSSDHYKEYDPEPGLDGRKGHEGGGSQPIAASTPRYGWKPLLVAVAGGIATCLVVQPSPPGPGCYTFRQRPGGTPDKVDVYAPPWVGSTTVHNYPPPAPTNDFPELFPTECAPPSCLSFALSNTTLDE